MMATKKIDFGKCKNFDELCGLLNMLDIEYTYDEDKPDTESKFEALSPYFADEQGGG